MAIRITEDGSVIYENEPNVNRQLFPNLPEGYASQEQITQAVDNWLEDHPEATTTVTDGSITREKLDSELNSYIEDITNSLDSVDTEIGELKENLVNNGVTGKAISFSMAAGSTHSSLIDRIAINLPIGSAYIIKVTAPENLEAQIYEINALGESVRVKTGRTNIGYSLVASVDVELIGVYVAAPENNIDVSFTVAPASSVKYRIENIEYKVSSLENNISFANDSIVSTEINIEQGYWAATNGLPVTSTTWCRTKNYLPKHYIVKTANAFRVFLAAYDENDAYIGIWTGNDFVKSHSNNYGKTKANIPVLNKKYPAYRFKATFYSNGAAITPEDVGNNITLLDSSVIDPSGIVELNGRAEEILLQAKRTINIESNQYLSATQPLVLLHFSDIHAATANLRRIVEFRDHIADKIDDTICTGDMVADRFNNGMAFWDAVDGTENILMLIGNHDALAGDSGYDWTNTVTQQQQYDRFIAPYVTNWNCTYTSGLTYYYKDYAEKKVRLICLNCMLKDTDAAAQLEWLNATLTGAKTLDYYVIIAVHYPISDSTVIACNFSSLDKTPSQTQLGTEYMQGVDDFVTDGGKFVCYIAGHTHWDDMLKATNSNQLCIVIDAASMAAGNQWGDTMRTEGTKSQDCANLFVFDSVSGVIKIIRVGADMDHYLREKNCITIKCSDSSILTQN